MVRTICPQMGGVYENVETTRDDELPYLIIQSHPSCEFYVIDAIRCDKNGIADAQPECDYFPVIARAFGDFIMPTPPQELHWRESQNG